MNIFWLVSVKRDSCCTRQCILYKNLQYNTTSMTLMVWYGAPGLMQFIIHGLLALEILLFLQLDEHLLDVEHAVVCDHVAVHDQL